MKLERILDQLNSFEKNAFLKIIDAIVASRPAIAKEVDKILSSGNGDSYGSRDFKNLDHANVARVFHVIQNDFAAHVKSEFSNTASQLDILIDIISRDGNCIIKQDWFARLYEKEIGHFNKRLKEFKALLEDEKSVFDEGRKRDYQIYLNCLRVAYHNDDLNNLDRKVTSDELSILVELARQLELSQEEVKLINYLIIPVKKLDVDTIINELKTLGIVFYSKKNNTVYVADEMVRILRKVRGKEVSDKHFRRVLRLLREPQINVVCKKHNIDWKLTLDEKIREIIAEGISMSGILMNDIHKSGTTLTDRKKFLNEMCDKHLGITPALKGATLDEKMSNLILHFENLEQDERVGISMDGYEKLLTELNESIPTLNNQLRAEFQFQEEQVMRSSFLLDFNIKPRDILEILPDDVIKNFCVSKGIKLRGDLVPNILEAYKDSENLYLENYVNIGQRNIAALKENGILVKEADLGVKFEELTKKIFEQLGFTVDEVLRKKLNTMKDKIDILINLGNNDVILVECKTAKESGYNKFSAVSRQLKAYTNLAKLNDLRVVKSLLVAPDFSDDFIRDCGLEYELNLSLLTAASMVSILEGFKNSKHKVFPHNLLMRDVLIQEDRVLKAIGK